MSRTYRTRTFSGWHRRPKTQNERRQIEDALEQGVRVRHKRRDRRLPDSYDDLLVAARYEQKDFS